jgi:hypothetical protein
VIRFCIALAFTIGCINQAKQAVAPDPPQGTGTLSCSEIVNQCDTQCGDPICIQRCSNQGNADGAPKHAALVDCGQRNNCTDQDCIQANCPNEIAACMSEPAPPPGAGDMQSQPPSGPDAPPPPAPEPQGSPPPPAPGT